MFLLFSGQGLLYVIDLALFGETLANMSYPLIVHFPLVLFLSVHYKYPLPLFLSFLPICVAR